MDERQPPKGAGPGEILGMSGAYWKSLALHAGVRLDIFTVIGDARLGGAEIARRVEGDERGVTTLLEALAALGLLDRTDAGFANAPAALTYLVRGSANYFCSCGGTTVSELIKDPPGVPSCLIAPAATAAAGTRDAVA